ncbi:ABEC4 enzyme, partial [Rhinopomastus cyanomelas]|nr:ABEC4 enzyme [Rhinopomastus cyanomelas]
KRVFQEYLTNQGTVVKPFCWQRQSRICAKCPYHVRTGEEARVPYEEFQRTFGSPYGSGAALQNKHLLFYELRSFSGTVIQKGHATNCTAQESHPESMLFQVGAYLDALADAYKNIRSITLYSNYSPCNEASHCCVSKIYNFLLKYPEIRLCIYFSQLYHAEGGSPTAVWNQEALRSLSSLWPQMTLQRLPREAWPHLLCHFVFSIPGSTPSHLTPSARSSADGQNPHKINSFPGIKSYIREVFPRGIQGEPMVQRDIMALPFQGMKGTLLPSVSQSHSMFLPFQREYLHFRPKNIVRHLKMPKE